MLKELVVATHNQGKVEEFKTLMKDLPRSEEHTSELQSRI